MAVTAIYKTNENKVLVNIIYYVQNENYLDTYCKVTVLVFSESCKRRKNELIFIIVCILFFPAATVFLLFNKIKTARSDSIILN